MMCYRGFAWLQIAFLTIFLTGSTGFVRPLCPSRSPGFNINSPISSPPAKLIGGSSSSLTYIKGVELSDLIYDSTSTAFDAWEWTANLGAPAALVAGAVLVTLGETREKMGPRSTDKKWVRYAKQATRFLLLSSFALEVISIFVSTMCGSVLLSHPQVSSAKKAIGYGSPLALLHHHHEFEYLTIELGFLQGLIHWLGAAALEVLIPYDGETDGARRMNRFMGSCLLTLIFWIIAFYNHHLSFYSDYMQMVRRYLYLFFARYFMEFRPMAFLYGPSSIFTGYLGWKAFSFKSKPKPKPEPPTSKEE